MEGKNVIIIGGGPAGISAALYTVRAGIDTAIILHGESALDNAESIENFYGFPGGISGPELRDRGIEQAKKLGVKILEEEVLGLDFGSKPVVKTQAGRHEADAVIIAMGSQRKAPAIEGIKEFEGRGVSYCAICDGFFYKGKTVAVLGGGDYADSEASELEPLAERVIRLTDAEAIEKFAGDDKIRSVEYKDGSSDEIDGLFIAYGTAGPGDLAKKMGIMLNGNSIIVNENMETNVPGFYAAGDCTGGLMQVSKAVADGAIAGTSVVKYLRS